MELESAHCLFWRKRNAWAISEKSALDINATDIFQLIVQASQLGKMKINCIQLWWQNASVESSTSSVSAIKEYKYMYDPKQCIIHRPTETLMWCLLLFFFIQTVLLFLSVLWEPLATAESHSIKETNLSLEVGICSSEKRVQIEKTEASKAKGQWLCEEVNMGKKGLLWMR